MKWIKLTAVLVCLLTLSACVTTALYGEEFELKDNNQYSLQIAFGGLPLTPEAEIELTTRNALDVEAKKFMRRNPQFTSYKIISYSRKHIPSAIVYLVEFEPTQPKQSNSQ
ncbi:hypothetical protein A7985_03845 [Pseudoalteromonas luteoviolacea]|uniref:Lipoprotein n=1 Tax=Pseudoalteromonas luteoviolacea TaxID=43657 RepID=A0A1C0TUV0_9GAMM|nr:hypothetical protein [Pseudoalteromonas luteoviolacea]MBQ4812473.1 hypothetical protein [Pseudoalteromonas luteoviolacea]OCQ23093.1 hypothetical protein A7985_03845 [Pseudoalteromonas luteoviolacea]